MYDGIVGDRVHIVCISRASSAGTTSSPDDVSPPHGWAPPPDATDPDVGTLNSTSGLGILVGCPDSSPLKRSKMGPVSEPSGASVTWTSKPDSAMRFGSDD